MKLLSQESYTASDTTIVLTEGASNQINDLIFTGSPSVDSALNSFCRYVAPIIYSGSNSVSSINNGILTTFVGTSSPFGPLGIVFGSLGTIFCFGKEIGVSDETLTSSLLGDLELLSCF